MDFWHVILALKSKSSYEIPMYVEVFPPRLGEGGEGGGGCSRHHMFSMVHAEESRSGMWERMK